MSFILLLYASQGRFNCLRSRNINCYVNKYNAMRITAVIGNLINRVFRKKYTPPATEIKLPYPVEAPAPRKFLRVRRTMGSYRRNDDHDDERIEAAEQKRLRRRRSHMHQVSLARAGSKST